MNMHSVGVHDWKYICFNILLQQHKAFAGGNLGLSDKYQTNGEQNRSAAGKLDNVGMKDLFTPSSTCIT